MGLNLGSSARHARNANLILNFQTGTTSPQFHVQYDEFYKTAKEEEATSINNSWHVLAKFIRIKEKKAL